MLVILKMLSQFQYVETFFPKYDSTCAKCIYNVNAIRMSGRYGNERIVAGFTPTFEISAH